MGDLSKFLTMIRTAEADYILGWDANTAHDHNEIQDFLQDHDMTDAFTEFFDERPPTHINGLKQIDFISVSRRLVPYIDRAFILSLKESKGDHSTIGINFSFGALSLHGYLSEIDPGHAENRNLVSTDVKASTAFLKIVKKKHCTNCFNDATEPANVLTMINDCTKISAICFTPMRNRLKKNVRR
jgi:hypothetical protein